MDAASILNSSSDSDEEFLGFDVPVQPSTSGLAAQDVPDDFSDISVHTEDLTDWSERDSDPESDSDDPGHVAACTPPRASSPCPSVSASRSPSPALPGPSPPPRPAPRQRGAHRYPAPAAAWNPDRSRFDVYSQPSFSGPTPGAEVVLDSSNKEIDFFSQFFSPRLIEVCTCTFTSWK